MWLIDLVLYRGRCGVYEHPTYSTFVPLLYIYPETTSCDSLPCENGGTCVPEGDGSYSCTCPLGYKGAQCDESETLLLFFLPETRTLPK